MVGRPGRLPASNRGSRREQVLDAALAVLVEGGYSGMTMLSVASRAGASKETLYAWFDSREGLLTALVERNADGTVSHVRSALDAGHDPRETLTGFAIGLLRLLTSPASVALNRAAMGSPSLAQLLLTSGRHRVGPLVEDYLARLHADRRLFVPQPAAGFRLLYGLVVQDTQIRVLLGERPPSRAALDEQGSAAVEAFLQLARSAPLVEP